jgi:hypothetical protein
MTTSTRAVLFSCAWALALTACGNGAQDAPAAGEGGGSGDGSGGDAGATAGGGAGGKVTAGGGGGAAAGGGGGGTAAGGQGGRDESSTGGAITLPDAGGAPDGGSVDLGAAPDLAGAGGAGGSTGGPRRAAIVWGYGEHQPTPKPTAKPLGFDLTMKARLEAKGLTVTMLEDAVSTVADVKDLALLVISSSINRTNLFDAGKPRFKDVTVPTIVMKDGTIEVMGLGAGSAGGFSTGVGETQITIIAPGDPLAAGLTGNVTVYTKGDRLIWAAPAPAAKKIATIVGNAKEIAIFAYDAGAMMVGGFAAPAKRMGFFIHRNTDYSPDGVKLFDAAVDYLLAP